MPECALAPACSRCCLHRQLSNHSTRRIYKQSLLLIGHAHISDVLCLLGRCCCALCQLDQALHTKHGIQSIMGQSRSFFHHYLGLDCACSKHRIENEDTCRMIMREKHAASGSLTLGAFVAYFLVCSHVLQAGQQETVTQTSTLKFFWECWCTDADATQDTVRAHDQWSQWRLTVWCAEHTH